MVATKLACHFTCTLMWINLDELLQCVQIPLNRASGPWFVIERKIAVSKFAEPLLAMAFFDRVLSKHSANISTCKHSIVSKLELVKQTVADVGFGVNHFVSQRRR